MLDTRSRVTFSTTGTVSRSGRGSTARKLPNGDTYEGGWDKGRPHGRGSYTWVSPSPPPLAILLQVRKTSPCVAMPQIRALRAAGVPRCDAA
jgi:hypothetical protein